MATLGDALARYYAASETASKIVRQLALAGVGFVWLLSGGVQPSGLHIRRLLLAAGLALCLSMLADLAQYLFYVPALKKWTDEKEAKIKQSEVAISNAGGTPAKRLECDIGDVPNYIPSWGSGFFWTKMTLMAFAYVLIAIDLASRLHIGK